MAYDGSLKFDTKVDSTGFKSGIDKLGSIAKTGLKATVSAIGAVTTAFGAAATSGVKYNAQMEQYITSFGTMLGTAEEAAVLVNNLKEMGAKTPFETADLAKGAQTLLAFGTAADELLPTMQMLGDVSQGNKERFDSLTLAFAQVGSAGKLSGQDLLQFINAGFNPLNEISKMTGESMAELKERMSDGGVSAEEVAAAFRHATEEGGQFYQAMEAQSQTFNGQMSTLKDNAMSFMGELTEGVTNTLKDSVLPTVNDWLGQLQEAFSTGGVEGVVTAFGAVLADACTQLAEAAPGVIELAVGFIQSFIGGVADNAPQLIQAAKKIVWALVDGLVKLLPKEIQKPVRETVNNLKKSFQDGGLRKAINTVGDILKKLGTVITNLAKAVLPPLSKAVDFLAGHLDTLLPLTVGIVAAIKGWSIVQQATKWFSAMSAAITAAGAATSAEALATAASTGALTLKQIAVGVLTGQIGLATAAQWLWNAAMNANPIGIVITAVAALAAGIGLLVAAQDSGVSGTDRLYESSQKLGESFENISIGAENWRNKIDAAKSSMDGFNDSILVSQEDQQKLSEEMETVQSEITEIAKLAAGDREKITDEEVQRLEDLLAKMRDLSQQELELYQGRQDVVLNQMKVLANSSDLTASQFEDMAARIIKASEEETQAIIDKAYEKYVNQVALNDSLLGTAEEFNQDWLDQANETAQADYQAAVEGAEAKHAEILAIESQSYLDRNNVLEDFLLDTVTWNAAFESEQNRFNRAKKYAQENETAELQRYLTGQESLQEEHDGKISELQEKHLLDFNEATIQQAGAWLQRILDAKEAGAILTEDQKQLAKSLITALDSLPEDMNEQGKLALEEFGIGLDDKGNVIYTKGEHIGEKALEGQKAADQNGQNSFLNGQNNAAGFISGLSSKVQAAWNAGYNFVMSALSGQKEAQNSNSPAKETIELGKDNADGYALGLDKNAQKAISSAEKMVSETIAAESKQGDFLRDFWSSKIDVSAMVHKMKAAIAAESGRLSSSISAPASYAVVRDSTHLAQTESGKPSGRYVAHVQVNLDGREAARGIAPFMGEQLAWEG